MPGFRGGESPIVVQRKRGYVIEAGARWPFLTYFDASTINNEQQLEMMVKERCSLSRSDAETEVRQRMQGKVS